MLLNKSYLPYYKSNLRLAIPVIISQVGQISVQLVDTIMVGHINAQQLAAVAFANTLAWPILFLGTGVAMGLTPLTGKATAIGNFSRSTSLLKNSLRLNILLGVAMTLVILGISFLMEHMGQDPSIIPTARKYIYFQVASALPMMLFSTSKQFLEGLGNTTYAMVISITGNLLNVVMNFILIYGWWIFPEMGAVGAGASTFISRVVMVIMFVWLFTNKAQYRRYFDNFRNTAFCKFRTRRLLNVGVPIAMQLFIEVSIMSLMAIVVGFFGAESLAAHQIAMNIPSFSFMVVTGLSAATTIRVSQEYGLRLYESMYMSLKASLHLITAYMTFSAIVIAIFARPIASIFTTDPMVIDIASYLLLFGAIFQIPDGIQGVILGGLRGMMVVKPPMYYSLAVYALISVPVGYLCSFQFGFGASGSWIAFITALSILAVLYFRLFIKRYNSIVERQAT